MLNLKELEKKLDNALAKETSESLSKWLTENRTRSHLALLGEGSVQPQKQLKVKITSSEKIGSSSFKINSKNLINIKVHKRNSTNYKSAA